MDPLVNAHLSVHLNRGTTTCAHRAHAFRFSLVKCVIKYSVVRPYLAANFGFFELRTFPWSPSKIEVGTFYHFTLTIYVHALVWSQRLNLEVVTCKFLLLKRPIASRKVVVGRGVSMIYTYFGRILLLWSNLMHSHFFFSVNMQLAEFFHFRCVCRIFFS